jgi:MoxR-like ATPase
VQPVLTATEVLEMQRLAREVPIAGHVKEFALKVMLATHPESELAPELTNRFVRYGSSPRGAQAIILASKIRALLHGRFNVAYEDVEHVALPALRHRLILNFEGQAEGIAPDEIVRAIVVRVMEAAAPKVSV